MTKPIDLEPAGMEAARRKGRELAGNQPGALVEAFAEVAAAGAAAYLSAARSAPEAGRAVDFADGIPFELVEKVENRIAYRISLGSTPRAIAEDVLQLALASPAPSGAEPVEAAKEEAAEAYQLKHALEQDIVWRISNVIDLRDRSVRDPIERAVRSALAEALLPPPVAPQAVAPEAFPPTTCNAWEDCNHDGLCHDPQTCGGIGPNSRDEPAPQAVAPAEEIAGRTRRDDHETYEIGKRDGYEDAIQDLDLATGGDGEFRGSTIPGETVDVPAMKRRIIERFTASEAEASDLRRKLEEHRKALERAAVAAYDEPYYLGPGGMERGPDGLLPPGSPYDRGRYDARKAVEKITRAVTTDGGPNG